MRTAHVILPRASAASGCTVVAAKLLARGKTESGSAANRSRTALELRDARCWNRAQRSTHPRPAQFSSFFDIPRVRPSNKLKPRDEDGTALDNARKQTGAGKRLETIALLEAAWEKRGKGETDPDAPLIEEEALELS